MARQKQTAPLRREPSDFENMNGHSTAKDEGTVQTRAVNGSAETKQPRLANSATDKEQSPAGLMQLVICVAGIYASFLSWALLQERITTTTYGGATIASSSERFAYPVFLNTIQSLFASMTGFAYLLASTPSGQPTPSIFPSRSIFLPLVLVSITSSLASPFGYASLGHIDYLTFILAKSCKLLPVMFLHLTVFRKSYPLYKYMVVLLVTAGVAVFTVYHPSSKSKSKSKSDTTTGSSTWGLILLSINLLFDGLTNSTQDHIFTHHKSYTGPQMMVAQNLLSTLLTILFLLFSPLLTALPFPSAFSPSASQTTELSSALSFLARHPGAFPDILAFAACGAVGQIFIYYTLSRFSSLLLVTVTVTRKMLTMMLSVLWFGHTLSGMQWVGVGLVFGGVGAEGVIQRREKIAKGKAKAEEKAKSEGKKEL